MSAVPVLQDELDRKSFMTIEWLFRAFEAGKLSEAQFSTGVDALFMAVGGLTAKDTMEMVTEAGALVPSAFVTEKTVLHKAGTIPMTYLVSYVVGEGHFTVRALGDGRWTSPRRIDQASPAAAKLERNKLVSMFIGKGYVAL